MSSSREQHRLRDIIDNIDAIHDHIAGMDQSAFAADRKTVDAVERVRGLGNLLRHEYDLIDLRLIYNLLLKDRPSMRAACNAALES